MIEEHRQDHLRWWVRTAGRVRDHNFTKVPTMASYSTIPLQPAEGGTATSTRSTATSACTCYQVYIYRSYRYRSRDGTTCCGKTTYLLQIVTYGRSVYSVQGLKSKIGHTHRTVRECLMRCETDDVGLKQVPRSESTSLHISLVLLL